MHFTTVTVNPCIDRTIQVDSVNLGHSHRIQKQFATFPAKASMFRWHLPSLECRSKAFA